MHCPEAASAGDLIIKSILIELDGYALVAVVYLVRLLTGSQLVEPVGLRIMRYSRTRNGKPNTEKAWSARNSSSRT